MYRAPALTLALAALWGLAASPALAEPSPRQTALQATVLLKVVQPAEARGAILTAAQTAGGHATRVSDHGVELKVPPARLSDLLRTVTEQGHVVSKELTREDLTEELADLEGKLRSKQSILGELRAFFDDSNLEATLDIERRMNDLVGQLEAVKGKLRVQQDRARWARVDVSFRFEERNRVVYVHSPFGWLNTVDLDRFVRSFEWRR